MTSRTLGLVELLLAGVALAVCVLSWAYASSVAVAEPVIAGEPGRSTTAYDPTMITAALIFATVAGLLAVAGVARVRHG